MHARFIRRKGVRLAASLAVFAAVTTAEITPASAAPIEYWGDNCGISSSSYYAGATCGDSLLLFYHKSGGGASASLTGNVSNLSLDPVYTFNAGVPVLQYYARYVFWGMASADNSGEGQGIRNNVASVSNTSSNHSFTLYVSPGFAGSSQRFGPNDYYANLDSQLVNNEASMAEG